MKSIMERMKEPRGMRWLFYGDSITHGAKHTAGSKDFSELFRERIAWELGRRDDLVLNGAYSGFTTRELLEKFDALGLLPENFSKTFVMTDEIRQHVADFRKLCRQLYSPGAADRIDWVCFQLCRDIFYADAPRPEQESDAVRIKNISVWLQQHFDENIDLDDLARANGFSRASFFRK